MTQAPQSSADIATISAHLHLITRRWGELGQPAMLELRAFAENRTPQTAKFRPDWIDEPELGAAAWASGMNALRMNVYAVINPIRDGYSGSAKDTDILGSFYLWADCDDENAARNVLNFVGPKWTAAVTTGTIPTTRAHVYWELEEPCLNLDAWRAMQSDIAATFQSDRSVINPSRIMRLAGTVTYPDTKKQGRGYVQETAKLRTEYDDGRAPIAFDRIRQVFAPQAPVSLSQQALAGVTPQSGGMFQIDTGGQYAPPLDRERATIQALSGMEWHNAVIRLVASYVSRGLSDGEIHALTDPLTLAGYTVEQTRAEVQTAIDGARRKGWTPEAQPAPSFAPVPQIATLSSPQSVTSPGDSVTPDASFDAPPVPALAFPTVYDFFDAASLEPRQWIYGRHYLRRFVSVLASPGGIGKTSLQIVEALAIATGKPLLGERVEQQCNVWLVNLEDPIDEMQRRILAAMQHYGITPDEVRGKFFMDAGREFSLKFAKQDKNGFHANTALVEYLAAQIPAREIGTVFIDPFVSTHDVNENDNGAINAVVDQIRRLADETNTAWGLVHHTRKTNGEEVNIESVRGAGSLISAARAARVINKVSPDMAAQLGIPPHDAKGLFRVDDGKANLAPPQDSATYRRMLGVQIANGEWVGVAAPFDLPDEWAGITPEVANDMLDIIGMGIPDAEGRTEYYSARPQDPDRWAGRVVMQYAFDNPAHAKNEGTARRVIKQWIETGLLEEFSYRSEKQRKDRKGLRKSGRVGEIAE